MGKIWMAGLFCVGTVWAHAQVDSTVLWYAATITEADLRKHLEVLASDAYEGRETGMKGQKMAATYLEQQFRSFGIPPIAGTRGAGLLDGYQQSFALELTRLGGIGVRADKEFTFLKDYFYFSEYLQEDLRSTALTIVRSTAMDQVEERPTADVVLVLDEGSTKGDATGGALQRIARAGNAIPATRVLLLVDDHAEALMKELGHYLGSPRMRLAGKETTRPGTQVIVITPGMADDILAKAKSSVRKAWKRTAKGPLVLDIPLSFSYAPLQTALQGENILAYIEGSEKKNEVVVVTAHYDHIGITDGEVYNGADDDGSGTVAVLEMAEAMARANAEGHGPLRSVLFMPVSGEEKGLLGSEYYSEHPVFPLDSTVADVNIDMIGRVDTLHRSGAPYVYVIGSDRLSSGLHRINEEANTTYVHLDLDYRFNAESDPNRFYYRSDHYNFAKHGIPSIFYFSGVHEDYHGPKDEVDRIRFDLLHQRTLLAFHTVWMLANAPERIVVDRPLRKE